MTNKSATLLKKILEHEALINARLDRPVIIFPSEESLSNVKQLILSPKEVKMFIEHLISINRVFLIENTIQSLYMRDGVNMLTAILSIDDLLQSIKGTEILNTDLIESWKKSGSREVNIDFEDSGQAIEDLQ